MTVAEILKNGGATLNHKGQERNLKSGYQVSFKDLQTVPAEKFTPSHIEKTMKQAEQEKAYIGLWLFKNKVYIDLSRRIATKKEALKKGKELNQKAIYDWKNKMVITV